VWDTASSEWQPDALVGELTVAASCQNWHIGGEVEAEPKTLIWVGSSLADLKEFPEEVRQVMGYALYLAQVGKKHQDAKPLTGFKGAGVLEVVEDFDGNTYRAVYTARLKGAVYVLHAFQKKSRKGVQTPRQDVTLIESRLKMAERIHARRQSEDEGERT
jgi:phage-related protein